MITQSREETAVVDFERTSAFGSSGSRSAGLLLAALAALVALVGACTTAGRAPGTADAVDPADAIAEYREAVRLDPTNAELWLRLGQLYEQAGREEEALQSLEKGLEADPGNAGIMNHIGWLYATTENPTLRNPAKAIAYAQRAVEATNGSDANFLDTLAEAYYANQQFDEAIETELRALEIAPGLEANQNQLEKFRDAKAAASGR